MTKKIKQIMSRQCIYLAKPGSFLFKFLVLIVFYFAQCRKSIGQKQLVVKVDGKKSEWYYLIFTEKSNFFGDTILLDTNRYVILGKRKDYGEIKLLNGKLASIKDSVRLIGFREVKGYQVFQFYYPTKQEAKQNFNKREGLVVAIEIKSFNDLNAILKNLQ